jgi:long-chain acyl-CoA synthetase
VALVDLLLRKARTRPDVGAIFHGTRPHATHAQWAARSAGLAQRLRAEGLVPGDRV